MKTLVKTNTLLMVVLVLPTLCFSQTNPKNVPQPPTDELKKFDPFLGKYNVSGDFANSQWAGTLELKRVIKGWYIQQIILVKTEGIDREFWLLATWDKSTQKYRLWGFQTLPFTLEGDIRFEGGEMITEWVSVRPDGTKVSDSNRYRLTSNGQLEIASYRQAGNEPLTKIGFLTGERMP
jgi:hypothetical protein